MAFYDALETNDSAVQVLGDETLRAIARELVDTVRNNVTIDWTLRENVRARLRAMVKRILRKNGYPPEETAALIQCLEDETLLRLFLTGLIGQTGPLSAETSTCVRSGFANFDLRSVMLATPAESNEAAAMAVSMAGFLLTLSCLSEEEWQAVGPT